MGGKPVILYQAGKEVQCPTLGNWVSSVGGRCLGHVIIGGKKIRRKEKSSLEQRQAAPSDVFAVLVGRQRVSDRPNPNRSRRREKGAEGASIQA